jgi:hypothetical protein
VAIAINYLPREMAALPISWGELMTIDYCFSSWPFAPFVVRYLKNSMGSEAAPSYLSFSLVI